MCLLAHAMHQRSLLRQYLPSLTLASTPIILHLWRKSAMKTLTIQLPDEVYIRLQHAAHGNEKRVRQVAVQMLSTALPPDDTLPQGMQRELRVLESLSDDVLWAVVRSKMAAAKQRRWKRLLDKQYQGTLTASERQELEQLIAEGDR